jgi:hypothetical protein
LREAIPTFIVKCTAKKSAFRHFFYTTFPVAYFVFVGVGFFLLQGKDANRNKVFLMLTLSKPIFLPPAYSPALIYFGRERGWWITCNYPTVLKEKNRNKKSTTCTTCWLKSALHEEKRREQENHNVGQDPA